MTTKFKLILFLIMSSIGSLACVWGDLLPLAQPEATHTPLSTETDVVVYSTSMPTPTPTPIATEIAPTPTNTPSPQTWQHLSEIRGGAVSALAVSPNFAVDQTVFAGLVREGVFRSTNGGQSWQRVTPVEENIDGWEAGREEWRITKLVISPNYAVDQTVLITTDSVYHHHRLYYSNDAGATWHVPKNPDGFFLHTSSIWFVSSDGTIYAHGSYPSSLTNLFRSTDGGRSFEQLDDLHYESEELFLTALSPTFIDDQTFFADSWDGKLYISSDAGITWSPFAQNLSGYYAGTMALSPEFNKDGLLFVAISKSASSQAEYQVYRSTDKGENWSMVLESPPISNYIFSPNFANDQTMFAYSDTNIYYSTDAGLSWLVVEDQLPQDRIVDMVLSPNYSTDRIAFFGHASWGIYQTTTGINSGNWHLNNHGLPHIRLEDIVFNPANPNEMFLGVSLTQIEFNSNFLGSVYRSTDGGYTWQRPLHETMDSILELAISPGYNDDHTVFAVGGHLRQHGDEGGAFYQSKDSGRTWSNLLNDLFTHIAVSPGYSTDQTVFIYSMHIYHGLQRSLDGGQTWTREYTGTGSLSALALSPNYVSDGTILIGNYEKLVQRSTDRGESWTTVIEFEQEGERVRDLVFSPNFAHNGRVYLATTKNLYVSADGGNSWQQITHNLPGQYFHLVVDPQDHLYASAIDDTRGTTVQGVYRSTNGGEHWEQLDFPLTITIHKLKGQFKGQPNDWSLFALTDHGIWAYK